MEEINAWVGLDVGKSDHHATGVDAGRRMLLESRRAQRRASALGSAGVGMVADPFTEPSYRLKLRRAEQHLNVIDGEVRAFMERDLSPA